MKKTMGHGCIPVETLSDHGISTNTNGSKLSVAWLIGKMLMENEEELNFCGFYFTSFGEALWIRNLT